MSLRGEFHARDFILRICASWSRVYAKLVFAFKPCYCITTRSYNRAAASSFCIDPRYFFCLLTMTSICQELPPFLEIPRNCEPLKSYYELWELFALGLPERLVIICGPLNYFSAGLIMTSWGRRKRIDSAICLRTRCTWGTKSLSTSGSKIWSIKTFSSCCESL